MPRRSAVSSLPKELREELDRRLIDAGFQGYQELSDWLGEQGYRISKSAINRHGRSFQEELVALKAITGQARAITEAAGDDENAIGDAALRMCLHKALEILRDYDFAAEDISFLDLTQAISRLNKIAIDQKKWLVKWRLEFKDLLEQKFKNLEGEIIRKGLDGETLKVIRQEVYGIFDEE